MGVLLDEARILPAFDYTFYEAKPSSGRIRPALANAWNVINCFADNTVSQEKPEWVATFRGQRAVRSTRKRFLWDWICPSRVEYREYCLNIIRKIASQDVAGIRLDSICFPREGYCDCSVCTEAQAESGEDFVEWRAHQITSFIRDVRANLHCRLGLTLEPDPCCGKERFGLDLVEISKYVDFLSTPLYMDYSIVYWLDILANCFRSKISKPYFIELYAGHPRVPVKYLASALAVASSYADCIVLSTYQASVAESIRQEMIANSEIWNFFEERDCDELLRILEGWRKIS